MYKILKTVNICWLLNQEGLTFLKIGGKRDINWNKPGLRVIHIILCIGASLLESCVPLYGYYSFYPFALHKTREISLPCSWEESIWSFHY